MAVRTGRIARMYTMSTISNNPNIALMSMKFGDFSSTNNAGTNVTIAKIFSPIQSSIGSSVSFSIDHYVFSRALIFIKAI